MTPLLCVFGVPRTLEQQPQRAMYAALALRQLASVEAARHRTVPARELRLAVPVGAVWVDSQAPEPTARVFAVGDTFGLPVRLPGMAAPGEIVRQRPHRVARLSEVYRLTGHATDAWRHACQALDLARQQRDRAEEALALHQLATVQAHVTPPADEPAEAH